MIADSPTHSLVENHRLVEPILATYGGPELHAMRTAAMEEFKRLGIPTAKHEEWKYTSLRALNETEFKPAYGLNLFRDDLKDTVGAKIPAATLTFVNGEFAPELGEDRILPDGVVLSTLQEALESHPEIVGQYLGRLAGNSHGKLGAHLDEPFVQLNTAYLSEGAFVYVPRGVALEIPLQVLFVSSAKLGPFAAHPRLLIVVEEAAQAKVLETYVGLDGVYFNNVVTEIHVGKGANVDHTKIQFETQEAFHIATIQAHQEADSVFASHSAAFGGQLARMDLNVWLNGEHTETWMNGVYVGKGHQVLDNHTRLDHAFPNCNSFEVYKGVLDDHAHGIFNGKIYVYQDAQKTDAKQTNQALLLSPTAQIDTKPQLEIFADDVKCTHGATVGQLREDARFYLQSRGIPKAEADALLVYAFAAEVLEKIGVPEAVKALESALYTKLGVGGSLEE